MFLFLLHGSPLGLIMFCVSGGKPGATDHSLHCYMTVALLLSFLYQAHKSGCGEKVIDFHTFINFDSGYYTPARAMCFIDMEVEVVVATVKVRYRHSNSITQFSSDSEEGNTAKR